ncbi:hypothetical protein TSUD_308320 [Trifolium subterraneum]|nr:hypothetical protein TSUD_308320 [Trifolium subterraneum]
MENGVDGETPTLLQIPHVANIESIYRWLQCKAKNVDGPTRKVIAVNAKMHLASRDWEIKRCNLGRYYFTSPEEQMFSNLFDACVFENIRNWKDDAKKEEGKEEEEEEEKEEEKEEEGNEIEKEEEKDKENDDAGDENDGHITCCLCNSTAAAYLHFEGNVFCSENCRHCFSSIKEELLFKEIDWGGATFVVMKVDKAKVRDQQDPRLASTLQILNGCFGVDPTYENMVYSEGQFSGFYPSIVQKDGKVASIAMIRFHTRGDIRMVEIPLVATHQMYRRTGMCHILFGVLEQQLTQLGISEIVLPAAKHRFKMWQDSFGFSRATVQDIEQRFGGNINILQFRRVILCSKRLI